MEEIIEKRNTAIFAVKHLQQNMEPDSFTQMLGCFLADKGLTDEFRFYSATAPVRQDESCENCGGPGPLQQLPYADDTGIGSIMVCNKCAEDSGF